MKQIKISLTEDNYKKLEELAEKNYRTLSQEVNYRLNQLLTRPGGPDAPSPLYFPPGVRSPIPTEFIPHNTPGGLQTPENPEGTPIITCDTGENSRPRTTSKKSLSFTVNQKNQDRRVNPLQSFLYFISFSRQ